MIHHVGLFASDFERSTSFYRAALAPLGVIVGYETADTVEFWHENTDTPSLSLERADAGPTTGAHLAFAARDRAAVEAFHQAALTAGGTERHPPGHWPQYRAFCTFVNDPDGNNIEAVHEEL